MNQLKSRLIVICIAGIYCFATALHTEAFFHATFNYSLKSNENGHFSDITKSLHTPPSASQSLKSHAPSGPVPGLKKTSELFRVSSEYAEMLLESELSQYIKYSEKQLIHFRKSDLIFPFHYFR